MASANFDFLRVHEPQLVKLGAQAEHYFEKTRTVVSSSSGYSAKGWRS